MSIYAPRQQPCCKEDIMSTNETFIKTEDTV
jgi:hypothetical protein